MRWKAPRRARGCVLGGMSSRSGDPAEWCSGQGVADAIVLRPTDAAEMAGRHIGSDADADEQVAAPSAGIFDPTAATWGTMSFTGPV